MANLSIVVAFDAKRGIGIDNKLPWHLPEDLAHFKRITTGHAIIMGRKTFESIGRPLPNRRNIVLTHNTDWKPDGVEIVHSLPAALELVGEEEAYIIGGAAIFEQALPLCHQLFVTEIHATIHCDTFFPAIEGWKETERTNHHSEKNAFDYSFITYKK